MTGYIAKQTNGQGKDPCQVANELDDKYQGTQPPDGSQKVLDVLGPMKFNADHMRKHDHCYRTGEGRVDTGSRWEKTGN